MATSQLNEIPTKVKKFIDDQKKNASAQIKTVRGRVQAESKTIEKWLNGNDWSKNAQRLQKELQKRVETLRAEAFHKAGLATKSDVEALQRKLNALNKKLAN